MVTKEDFAEARKRVAAANLKLFDEMLKEVEKTDSWHTYDDVESILEDFELFKEFQ